MYWTSCFSASGPFLENQDAFGTRYLEDGGLLACVADGVGGESRGEVASAFVTEEFLKRIESSEAQDLNGFVHKINKNLLAHVAAQGLEGNICTTFTAIVASNSGALQGIHVGDSRAFILRGKGIKQLTEDHTEAARFFKERKLSKENLQTYPRKHVLESAVGLDPVPFIQSFSFQLEPKDRVILMSDGAYEIIPKLWLRDASIGSENVEQLVLNLQNIIDTSTASDNYTVVCAEYLA